MDLSESVRYFNLALGITAYQQKVPWCTSMVMSPEELSFLYATKGGGPKQGMEGAMIGWLWPASGDRLTAQLPQDVWQTPDKFH